MNSFMQRIFASRGSVILCRLSHRLLSMDTASSKSNKAVKLTPEQRQELLDPLLQRDWKMVEGRDAIFKSYKFKNFQQAFSFMTHTALNAEKLDHHPEWFNVYSRVDVTLTTHSCGGISTKDVRMAGIMDTAAAKF